MYELSRAGPFYVRPRWVFGGPRDFWILNREFVGELIARFKLQPIEREYLIADDPIPSFDRVGEPEAAVAFLRPRPFPGGLRIAHLHWRDEVYQLDQEQWKEFSGTIIEGFQERLRQAGSVSFDQLMALGEVGNLG